MGRDQRVPADVERGHGGQRRRAARARGRSRRAVTRAGSGSRGAPCRDDGADDGAGGDGARAEGSHVVDDVAVGDDAARSRAHLGCAQQGGVDREARAAGPPGRALAPRWAAELSEAARCRRRTRCGGRRGPGLRRTARGRGEGDDVAVQAAACAVLATVSGGSCRSSRRRPPGQRTTSATAPAAATAGGPACASRVFGARAVLARSPIGLSGELRPGRAGSRERPSPAFRLPQVRRLRTRAPRAWVSTGATTSAGSIAATGRSPRIRSRRRAIPTSIRPPVAVSAAMCASGRMNRRP